MQNLQKEGEKLKLKKKAVCLKDRVEKITVLGGKIQEEPVSNNSEKPQPFFEYISELTQMSHFFSIYILWCINFKICDEF